MNKNNNLAKNVLPVQNIYHCCVQKTGSQWIKQILSSPIILENTGLAIHTPNEDYILAGKNRHKLLDGFPGKMIVSPLYILYENFDTMPKPINYKAFFIMRDPRDLIISRYFSSKKSHPMLNEHQEKERRYLNEVDIVDGISYFIEAIPTIHKPLYYAALSWKKAAHSSNLLLVRYEDLIGPGQLHAFREIFRHCLIAISDKELSRLLKENGFEKLSDGRKQGEENTASHYRKGIAGDWENYFSAKHKALFKKVAGQLLVDLDYEKSFDW